MIADRNSDQPRASGPDLGLDPQAVNDIVTAVEAQLPGIMNNLADLIGRAAPRIKAGEKQRFMRGLKRKMQRLVPVFAELEAMRGAPESAEKTNTVKAHLRALLIEMAAPPRIRKSPDAHRLDWFIAMAAKAANLPRGGWTRHPPYITACEHLWKLLISLYSRPASGAMQRVLDAWFADNDHRRYIHSVRLLTVAAGKFRPQPPQRISDRAAVDLQNEYLRSASIFEQQLRLLTCLAKTEPGGSKPWNYWQQQGLNNLMAMAFAHDDLRPLVSVLDRQVRNALTHGPPIIERAARRCEFWDHDKCVTWSWEEYFRRTRKLTLTVLGCANFESFRQLIEVQCLARFLAQEVEISGTSF